MVPLTTCSGRKLQPSKGIGQSPLSLHTAEAAAREGCDIPVLDTHRVHGLTHIGICKIMHAFHMHACICSLLPHADSPWSLLPLRIGAMRLKRCRAQALSTFVGPALAATRAGRFSRASSRLCVASGNCVCACVRLPPWVSRQSCIM